METKIKKPRFTKDEDATIIDCVKRNPQNLREAFRKAERLLDNRDFCSIKNRWYNVLSKKPETKCFMTIGVKSKNMNRKVVTVNTSDNTENIKTSLWNKILKLFK